MIDSAVNRLTTPRNRRVLKYATVGLIGVVVNELVLYVSVAALGYSYVLGGILSRVVSIGTNYALNDYWTWRRRGASDVRSYLKRGVKYFGTRLVGIAIGVTALIFLVEVFEIHYLVANLLAIGVGFLWGFAISERWVWRPSVGESSDPTDWQLRTWIREQRYELFVLTLALCLFVGMSILFVLRHRAYLTTGSDLGAYVQMFSTTLSGEGWLEHGKYRISHPQGSYWGAHFTVTLLVFLVPFALAPGPETLLIAKSLVLAASVPALWLVAREVFEDQHVALVMVISYAGNPFFWSAWLFDFQEQILIPLLAFLSYYCYVKRRYRSFTVAVALMLLTNEFLVPIVAGYLSALGIVAYRKDRLTAVRNVLLGNLGLVVAVYLLAEFVMGRFSVAAGIPIGSIADPAADYTEQWRLSMSELLLLYLENPQLLFESASHDGTTKLFYLVLLLAPVLFVAMFDETAIVSILPFIGFAWLFAGRPVYYEFGAHYPFYLLPFLYLGAVRALALPTGRTSFLQNVDWRTLLTLVLLANLIVGLALNPTLAVPSEDEHSERLDATLETLPEEATVLTQNDIYPHVATNPNASYVVRADMFIEYNQLYGAVEPEFIVLDTNTFWAEPVRDGFGDRLYEEYGISHYEDGVLVFERGYGDEPQGITDDLAVSRTYHPEEFATDDGEVHAGQLDVETTSEGDHLWYGPYDPLPEGTYEATVRFDVETDENAQFRSEIVASPGADIVSSTDLETTDGTYEQTIQFELEEGADVEIRGQLISGDATVSLQGASIDRIGPSTQSSAGWDE